MTRRPNSVRLPGLLLAGVFIVGAFFSGVQAFTPARAGGELVPDLAMAPLSDFSIQWRNGRKLLRFTAMMVNVGAGHFEVRGQRQNTSQPMTVRQILYASTSRNDANISRQITTPAVGKWSGDGHDHWHVQEMMRYDLWGNPGTLKGAKVGFCFLDSDPWNSSLPGYGGSYYRGSWCGLTPSALSNRMGISIGWGDKYSAHLAWQWVDVTGLPNGQYTLRSIVDPHSFFLEERENNQCAYAQVSISGNSVSLLGRASQCVNDWSDSPFAADIAWAWDTGVTQGCGPDLFCTNNYVNREQMASFLARALALPPATTDYFTDDEGSGHEDNINRIAQAGITIGCDDGRYCPRDHVRREQMASFLARAFALVATETDYFTDDEGSGHEDNINALAESGITLGCGGTNYCPKNNVTRGQMAAFLHRGSSYEPPSPTPSPSPTPTPTPTASP